MLTSKRSFCKLGLVLLLVSLLAGCGSSSSSSSSSSISTTSPTDAALVTLSVNSTADVSSLSGSIYALITAETDSESDNAPSTSYQFTLSSTAGTSTSSSKLASVKSTKATSSTANLVYSTAQIACDNMCRAKEKKLLANKAKQFSKKSASSSLLKSAAPSSVSLGDTWTGVNIYNTSGSSYTLTTINTKCKYISNHAYFFVDETDSIDSATLGKYGTAFDTIYENNHKYFGEENDTDNNGKIIIVFSDELTNGVLGYFYGCDKYSSTTYSESNVGDILYLTTDTVYNESEITDEDKMGTMAHEFQHMIYFDAHYNNGVVNTYTWLNEALSQAAEYYSGYTSNHLAWIEYFLEGGYSGLSLTHWTDNNYGFGAIFIRYLIDQYGTDAIKNMCSTQYVGIEAVKQATGVAFNTIFTNFSRALVLSDSGTSTSLYKFKSLTLSTYGGLATLSATMTAGSSLSGSNGINFAIYPYSINYYACSGTFATMTLKGYKVTGAAFGLSSL